MKKCPFCKADIEDNARFCLYCMKPLNEKEIIPSPQKRKPWWLLVVAAVLAAVVLLIPKGENGEVEELPGETGVPTESIPAESTAPTAIETQPTTEPTATQVPTEATPPPTASTQPQTQQHTAVQTEVPAAPPTVPTVAPTVPTTKPTATPTYPTTKPTATPTYPTTVPTEAATASTSAATTPTATPTVPTAAPTEVATAPTVDATAPTEPKREAVYSYRAARAGDDFGANYQNAGNDIVITGIAQPSVDGVYDIPEYIDGKKVIAIVANAFSGSNAATVYIPATVKTIWNHAFAGCALTDIYFRGNAVYTEGKAFPAGVTIHCAATCSDRNFRYYKNTADDYGATWQEWNG